MKPIERGSDASVEIRQYRIDYFLDDKKVADLTASLDAENIMIVARRGLSRNHAHYARIVDPERADKLVGLVHKDVRP